MSARPHFDGTTEVEQFWEGFYRRRARIWSGRVNPGLVDVVESLPAGRALDLGCGEGGDAIWLAGLGWLVTAVDVSATALERAADHAATAGVEARIDFQRHDLAHSFPAGAFDLVSAQYLESPVELPRDRILQAAARTVAPGGLLLVVTHASRPWASHGDPHIRFPTPQEALDAVELSPAEWHTVLLDAPERQATGPDGLSATVTDNVVAVRRRMP